MHKILLFIILSSLVAENYILSDSEILAYDIPPSVYLEELSRIQEKRARLGNKFMTSFYIGFGGLFLMAAPDAAPEAGGPGLGYIMGTLCLGAGIWSILELAKDDPKSLSMQRYVYVINESDNDIEEIKAYHSLVWLAKSSKKMLASNGMGHYTNSEGSLIKNLLGIFLINSTVEEFNLFTIEQRALDGFLTQMPIDVVF